MMQHQEWNKSSKDKLEFALNTSHKQKSPCMGEIPNFWISSLSRGYEKLAQLLSETFESPDTAPKWVFEGITYLSIKIKDTKNPKD